MKSASFQLAVQNAYRVDGRSLTVILRALKKAGFITSGGRGRHAPHMQPVDAARITIVLLATDKPARAVLSLPRFSQLTFQPETSNGPFPLVFGIEPGATFESVLTNLFTSDMDKNRPFERSPYVEVHENERRATIEFSNEVGKCVAEFKDARGMAEQHKQDRREFGGIRRTRGLASAELKILCVPFYCERRDGKSWEEICNEIDGRSESGLADEIPLTVKALLEPFVVRLDKSDG